MQSMATATLAKLLKLQPVRSRLLVFRRCIIAFFALCALQNNIIACHNCLPLSIVNNQHLFANY